MSRACFRGGFGVHGLEGELYGIGGRFDGPCSPLLFVPDAGLLAGRRPCVEGEVLELLVEEGGWDDIEGTTGKMGRASGASALLGGTEVVFGLLKKW